MRGENVHVEIKKDASMLTIVLYDSVGKEDWEKYIAKIQNEITNDDVKRIIVDFSACYMCVPIIVASIFLTIIRNGRKAVIKAPNHNNELYRLLQRMDIKSICEKYNIELYDVLNNGNTISYNCGTPLVIFNARKDNIQFVIKKTLAYLDEDNIENSVFEKIRNILVETVNNIAEHAYLDDEKSFGAIYIQKCYGLKKTSERITLSSLFEKSNIEYFFRNDDFYEICILDEGIGVSRSLDIRNKNGKRVKYPFSQSMIKTFIQGQRKKQLGYKSFYSGLMMLYSFLQEDNDYIYGREGNESVSLLCSESPCLRKNILSEENDVHGVQWVFHVGNRKKNIISSICANGINSELEYLNYIKINDDDEINVNKVNSVEVIEKRIVYKDIKNSFFGQGKREKEVIIWLIDSFYSKNKFFNCLYEILKNNHSHTLIIGDVRDQMLPVIYYAINYSSFPEIGKIKKIIIVSKSYKVQVFFEINGKFSYSNEMCIKYVENTLSQNISDSLNVYFSWFFQYESSVFWSCLLAKSNRDLLLVSGNIDWDDCKLDYYLNMEMILLERDIYHIVRNNLVKINDCSGDRMGYKNTDVIMKKMCIDINSTKKRMDIQSVVYVESVYVTGKTDQLIELDEGDVKICIFKNYNRIPSDVRGNINSLFVWPQKQFLESRITSNVVHMERLYDTFAIAEKKLIDYKDLLENSRADSRFFCNNYYTQCDIKCSAKKFISIGHFKYHNNHDLFAINQKYIIKVDNYKRSGTFLYVLNSFVNTIGKDCSNNLNAEWREVVSDNGIENEGIFVYRTHFYTSYIMDKVYECFNNSEIDIWRNVIALDQVEEKGENIFFHVSDLMMANIEKLVYEKMKKDKKVIITLFDTYSYTGKSLREIEQIIKFAIEKVIENNNYLEKRRDAIDIKKVVLFDCENNVYDISRNTQAYYHFEIPRLGTKNNCPLCVALKLARGEKYYLNSESAQSRIEEWIETWKAISPIFDNIENNRLANSSIIPEQILELVEISKISNNRNYIYDFCKNDNSVSLEQKLLLLSFQVLLFPPMDSYKDYNKVYIKIIEVLNSIEETNASTALASLVCLGINSRTIMHAADEIASEKKYLANDDIKILFALHCSKNDKLKETKIFDYFSPLLKVATDNPFELLKGFHSQLYNVNGDAHSTRFDKLAKPFGSCNLLINHCNAVYYSLEYLETTVAKLNPLLIRTEIEGGLSRSSTDYEREEVIKAIKNGKDLIRNIQNTVKKEGRNSLTINERKEFEEKVILPLNMFHRKLFVPYGKNRDECGKAILDEILLAMTAACKDSYDKRRKDYGRRIDNIEERLFYYYDYENERELVCFVEFNKVLIETTKRDIWYIWNQFAFEELCYLISDVRHSVQCINHRTYKNCLSMYINYEIDEDKILIKIHSMSDMSADEIKKRVEKKARFQRSDIERYGVSINYESLEKEKDLYELTTLITVKSIC